MSLDDLDNATLEWAHWFDYQRLFGAIGEIPPAGLDEMLYRGEVSAEHP